MNVDRIGTFRAVVVENGVGETRKAGYPQFLVNAKLLELWDEETETWVPWKEYEQDVDCRLCLFGMVGKKKEFGTTLTYDQVCKVFDWDGVDLVELANDKTGIKFQVRIDDNDPDYADKTPFQVGWVDLYDAEPGRKIAKLNVEELKNLNAKFAMILKKKGKTAAPTKAPTKVSIPETDESKPDLPSPKKAGKGKKQTKVVKTKAPAVPSKAPSKAPVTLGLPEGKCTKQEAWGTCCELKNDDCSDEQLGAAWHAAIAEKAPDIEEKNITSEQWFAVKDAVLDDVGKF
jgi:hypothetical protein